MPPLSASTPQSTTRKEHNFSRPRHTSNQVDETESIATPSRPSSPRERSKSGFLPVDNEPWRQSALRSPLSSPLPSAAKSQSSRAKHARDLSYGRSPLPNSPVQSPQRPSLQNLGMVRQASKSANKSSPINNSKIASMPDASLSAATHIELGIQQHECNQLPQSTHHFKVAADMNDPTGCLMYGLALRHGWGVRPDLQRSIAMLQKATDSVHLKPDDLRGSKMLDVVLTEELAVAIYEIGISYKNGWGVEPDKKLSLKYFELASDWGDVEAMVETAECYSQGFGCKKDKTKAARLLRKAEGLGKKEIGNSWIWKSKYD